MPFGKGKNDMVSFGICWYNIRERLDREVTDMMYPFMTLENDTEIVHSEKLENGEAKVYVETPDERDGFHNMTCYLPSYRVEINGYTEKEVEFA